MLDCEVPPGEPLVWELEVGELLDWELEVEDREFALRTMA